MIRRPQGASTLFPYSIADVGAPQELSHFLCDILSEVWMASQ